MNKETLNFVIPSPTEKLQNFFGVFLQFHFGVDTSKSGPPELRKALFLVMDCLLKTMPQDDPVYRFMDKKCFEGKPYLVYMTAGANKFLRIYYGKVKEYLAKLEEPSTADPG